MSFNFEVDTEHFSLPLDDVVHGAFRDLPCDAPGISCYGIRTGQNDDAIDLHMHDDPHSALYDFGQYRVVRARGVAALWRVAAPYAEKADPVLAGVISIAVSQLEQLANLVDDLFNFARHGETFNATALLVGLTTDANAGGS